MPHRSEVMPQRSDGQGRPEKIPMGDRKKSRSRRTGKNPTGKNPQSLIERQVACRHLDRLALLLDPAVEDRDHVALNLEYAIASFIATRQ